VVKKIYGTTKTTRSADPADRKRKKNDGRPPDTVAELLMPKAKKQLTLEESIPKKSTAPKPKTSNKKKDPSTTKPTENRPTIPKLGPASYRWNANSCWLDASLQVLYMTVTKKFDEFKAIFQHLKPNRGLKPFYEAINGWVELDLELEEDALAILMSQRDQLRIFLHKKKIITSLDRPESAVVSRNYFYMCSHSSFE